MKPTPRRTILGCKNRLRRGLLIERLETRDLFAAATPDFLYIGDASNDSIQKFDAATGAHVGSFVAPTSAGLHGPRGFAFHDGNLLVVNQNVDLPKNGEVLRYNELTGAPTSALVPASHSMAPFAPSGIVVRDNVAYVADTRDDASSGRILKYDATSGDSLGSFAPSNFDGEFRPRGLVFGPDGGLYVSVASMTDTDSTDPPGAILRFDITTGSSRVVAWNDGDMVDESAQGEAHNLHNPLGIVFSPDGILYVTSNRLQEGTSFDENTRIVIIDPANGKELDHIELAPAPGKFPTRHVTQSIVFGPNDKLFIPILVESISDGRSSVAILTLDPTTKQSEVFFNSSPFEQSIGFPLFAAFGETDPATLAYRGAVMDPSPMLSGIESTPLNLVIHDAAALVSTSISIRDHDSTLLGSATIRVSQNYQNGFDRLTFTNTPAIQGNWNSTSGTLTLVGSASLAAYQTALRSVRFQNTSSNPTTGARRVEFRVSDGVNNSNVLDRVIQFTAQANEFLYVGDQGDPADPNDDRVKKIDPITGNVVASFGAAGQMIGPRGVVIRNGQLLVVNQNAQQLDNGEVLRFDSESGSSTTPLIASNHPKSPVAPRGAVVNDNVLYVADAEGSSRYGGSYPPILSYNATTGDFLDEIVPNACFATEIHPRGLVFGPDGMLYASYFSTTEFASSDPPGVVLRFRDPSTGSFEVVAANFGSRVPHAGKIAALHNPEGVAFGPDGQLYVTSSRTNATDNGIVMLDVNAKAQVGILPLGQDAAQALLFGPDDRLYVPIISGSNGGGSLRVYEPATGNFSLLVTPLSGSLEQPWYLTFTQTDAATLAYVKK